MSHIFISYAHRDVDFANLLVNEIVDAGLTAWIDGERLRAGQDWRREIDSAIERACAVILIMTPFAKASEFVTYEWAYALGAKKPVIPVLREETELHPRLDVLQYLDFTDAANRPWKKLIRQLKRVEQCQAEMTALPPDTPDEVIAAIDALDSDDASERLEAVNTLAKIKHPSAREALAWAVQHDYPDVRVQAALKLAQRTNYRDTRAVAGLLEALQHDDRTIRRRSARAFRRINTPVAVSGLMGALDDTAAKVRESAAYALGEIGDASAVPMLVEVLRNDRSVAVRIAAAEALGKIGHADAVPELIEHLTDDERLSDTMPVSEYAAMSLEQIGTPDALAALEQWRGE
ncbi:MAG: TIR domain-containing protein [Chloroflexi bacterium]|nr:MAG: TIR domain-containing protein [Chloroflexota bacterium]